MIHSPEFILTLTVFAAAAAGVGLMIGLERKPRKTLDPRLVPTTPLLLIAGLIAIGAFVHLLNLAGLHTGRPLN